MTPEPRHTKHSYVIAMNLEIINVFFRLIGPRYQFWAPAPNARPPPWRSHRMVSMAAESTEAHRHRARANKRFAAGALCAARERGGVDVCGLVCVCAFEQHAHLKDVAPLPVEALESLVRPCPLIEFTCSKRDPSHWIPQNWCLGSSNSFANVSRARRSVHSAACTMEQRVPLVVQ